jgi:hypothetical protein
MLENSFLKKVPMQSIIYLGVCLLGILILVLGGILPASRAGKTLDGKVNVLTQQIEEKRILVPLQASLEQQTAKKPEEVLPLPPMEKMSPSTLNTLPRVFTMAAARSGVSLVSVVPNLSAEKGISQSITVDVGVRGTIESFRKFLIQVGGMSCVYHMEGMEVKVRPDNLDYKVKLLIAVG